MTDRQSRKDSGSGERACGPSGLGRGASLWLLAAAALGVLAVVALNGCGDLSLLDTLDVEEQALPLELGPEEAYVPVKTGITLSVYGGVGPYGYRLSGPGALIQTEDGGETGSVVYLAPDTIPSG
ncbi:MAG: hypothetical protein JW820_17825, partial [Spirochaetales bacterium]|nr:hypothetical protein [Spirochaetales bacterium]